MPRRYGGGRLVLALAVIAAAAVSGFFAYGAWFSGESSTEEGFSTFAVSTMALRATIATTGVAEAVDETALSFPFTGKVDRIFVKLGDEVKAGQPLARLDTEDLEIAVATAETNLSLARVRLRQVLAGADSSEVAAAQDVVASAEALYNKAANDLNDLLDGPTAAQLAAADESVESAVAGLETARNKLEVLTAPPSAAQISTAQTAVDSAESSFEQASIELDRVRAGPSAAELAAAEQKLESAKATLETAKSTLDALLSGPSSAAVAVAEANVVSARTNLDAAEDLAESADTALQTARSTLESALSNYCAADYRDAATCTPEDVPLSSAEVDAVISTACPQNEPNCVETSTVSALVLANNAYLDGQDSLENAARSVEVARAALDAAESQLAELGEPPGASEVAAAQAAVESAEAGVDAAQATLDDLLSAPSAEDVSLARAAYDAAESNLTSAQDALAELLEPADAVEVAAAEAAVTSAELALEAAELARDELAAGPTDREISNALAAAESAAASLNAAEAQRDKVLAGADSDDIELQQEQVRLAELQLQEAEKALSDATIVAAFDGTVAALPIRVGELVGPTVPAVTLLTPGALQLELTVGETELPEIEAGQGGGIQFDAIQGRPFFFVITELGLAPQVQQGVVTYVVRARLLVNDDTPPEQWPAPGMNGAAVIVTEQKNDVLAIPSRAIRRRGEEELVEVLVDGEVETRVVETGLTDNENTEILSGLSLGEEVILRGVASGGAETSESPDDLPEGIR